MSQESRLPNHLPVPRGQACESSGDELKKMDCLPLKATQPVGVSACLHWLDTANRLNCSASLRGSHLEG